MIITSIGKICNQKHRQYLKLSRYLLPSIKRVVLPYLT
jgi:hypothetical protein